MDRQDAIAIVFTAVLFGVYLYFKAANLETVAAWLRKLKKSTLKIKPMENIKVYDLVYDDSVWWLYFKFGSF